jgi:hypothetical protein
MPVVALALTLALANSGLRPARECVPAGVTRSLKASRRIEGYDSLLRHLERADEALVSGQSYRATSFLPTNATFAPVWQGLQEESRPAEIFLTVEGTKWVSRAKAALRQYDRTAARRDIARAEAALRRARRAAITNGTQAENDKPRTAQSLIAFGADGESVP